MPSPSFLTEGDAGTGTGATIAGEAGAGAAAGAAGSSALLGTNCCEAAARGRFSIGQ